MKKITKTRNKNKKFHAWTQKRSPMKRMAQQKYHNAETNTCYHCNGIGVINLNYFKFLSFMIMGAFIVSRICIKLLAWISRHANTYTWYLVVGNHSMHTSLSCAAVHDLTHFKSPIWIKPVTTSIYEFNSQLIYTWADVLKTFSTVYCILSIAQREGFFHSSYELEHALNFLFRYCLTFTLLLQ